MIAQLLPFFLALALWPLVVLTVNLAIYGRALMAQIPKIQNHYGGLASPEAARWLGLVLALSLVGVVVGSILVMQSPFADFSSSFATKPLTLLGLLLAAWSTFGFIVATEIKSSAARHSEEVHLTEVLDPWWGQQAA